MNRECLLCYKKHKARGFCNSHYQNFKITGDPLGKTRRPRKNCIISFLNLIASIPLNFNECKIWPMGISNCGYGNYSMGNITYSVHRLLYTTINNRPYHGLVVRHKCDNRACCNIDHLEIGTQSDNLMDASKRGRLRFGSDNNMSIFTEEQILKIRESYPTKSTVDLAREYGTSSSVIRNIIIGKTWKHIKGSKELICLNRAIGEKAPTSKLTERDVLDIRVRYPKETKAQLARAFGISFANARAIVNRKTWIHI